MRVTCVPLARGFPNSASSDLEIVLFSQADSEIRGSAGSGIVDAIRRLKLEPEPRAVDLLSVALAVMAADTGVRRDQSPDGWTREIDLCVAVADPAFWTSQAPLIEEQLRFLTTDIWRCEFVDGGLSFAPPKLRSSPEEDSVALLSGGLDSLLGVTDLVAREKLKPYVVSQVSQGDKERQTTFARKIGSGVKHLQLNHNAKCPSNHERSQRARSLIFLSYGVLAASALKCYSEGNSLTLYMCENGFISINPALTPGRLGALSTRTAHPLFLHLFQRLLDSAGLRVRVENPYQFMTKGEMLRQCSDQEFLTRYAGQTTSCGRFARNGYRHCGRCVPCLVRRAAFQAWGKPDETVYVYRELSRDSDDYARFDDVRSAAMAVAEARAGHLDALIGMSLTSALPGDVRPYRDTVQRGLQELGAFLDAVGVK